MIPLLEESSSLSFCKMWEELTLLKIHWSLIDLRYMQNFNQTSLQSSLAIPCPESVLSGASWLLGSVESILYSKRTRQPWTEHGFLVNGNLKGEKKPHHWNLVSFLKRRRQESWELPARGKCPGTGECGSARLHNLQLPTTDGEIRTATSSAAGNPGNQHAGWRVPLLQAPERGCPLQ